MKIIDIEKEPKYIEEFGMTYEDFINRSYIIGDTIILGIYNDEELKRFAFFHELGHLLVDDVKETNNELEREAWKKGLELAENIGIIFSEKCYTWMEKQIETYKD